MPVSRKHAANESMRYWMPAFAGMTKKVIAANFNKLLDPTEPARQLRR
jgi:hypothetical protein